MRQIIVMILLIVAFHSYGQDSTTISQHVDSIIVSIAKNNVILTKCDTVVDIKERAGVECCYYYFRDSSRNYLNKVLFSYNGAETLCYYYENNKVIKAIKNIIVNDSILHKWTVYIKDDKQIFAKGDIDIKRSNQVERAYYYSSSAFQYAKEIASR